MKLSFWNKVFLILFSFTSLLWAQEVGQVVPSPESEAKANSSPKSKVVLAFKTTLDSFGLDWSAYGVNKTEEMLEEKFNKSMFDWFLVNKIPNVAELVLINSENPNPDYTHLLQWNLFVRKINVQGKTQQFELNFDFFVAQKSNLQEPFYRGMHDPEFRTFPADLVKQVPDILQKSMVGISVPQWQKVRQTLLAMQSVQDKMMITIKNYKNIMNILNLIDYWKEAGKQVDLEAKLEKIDQSEGSIVVQYRGSAANTMKILTTALPVDQARFPFKLTSEVKDENLIFNLN